MNMHEKYTSQSLAKKQLISLWLLDIDYKVSIMSIL
jgi:hypothetical protein